MQVTLGGNGPTGGMGNFNWFGGAGTGAEYSFTGSPQSMPGQIQVENLRHGRQGPAYWNGATYNGGGANYRPGDTVVHRTRRTAAAATM